MDIVSRNVFSYGAGCAALLGVLLTVFVRGAEAQGAAPETAPPLFPGGALVSYNSVFTARGTMVAPPGTVPNTARPTSSHEGRFNFTCGFRPDFDLTILVPVVTKRFDLAPPVISPTLGGTGLGDSMLLVKYRFYRRDSERGTTQASVTVGPKIPTGRTNLMNTNRTLLPAALQPGSGSTDLLLGANWTYTGLFNVRRLVADEDFHSLLRSEGTQNPPRLSGRITFLAVLSSI